VGIGARGLRITLIGPDRTALNFMRVYDMSKTENFSDLNIPLSSLYLLAAPSTPEKARTEIFDRATSGEAPVTGPGHAILNDLSIPGFLGCTPTESTRG
jgi:hypothetical protein